MVRVLILIVALGFANGCVAVVATGHCNVHAVVAGEARIECAASGGDKAFSAQGAHVSAAFMAPFNRLAEAASGILRWFMPRASAPPSPPAQGDTFTRA